jgi:hypothetical protein
MFVLTSRPADRAFPLLGTKSAQLPEVADRARESPLVLADPRLIPARRELMRPFRVLIAMVTLLVAGNAIPAQADPITVSFGFVASDFGDGAPVDPVIGSFTLSFDNSVNLFEQTAGLTLARINIALDAPVGFAYGAAADALVLGSHLNGVQTLVPGTNDFLLGIIGVSTGHPRLVDFTYSQTGATTFFRGRAASLTPAPTPEPATLVLLLTGGALTLLRRRAAPDCTPDLT